MLSLPGSPSLLCVTLPSQKSNLIVQTTSFVRRIVQDWESRDK